MNTNFKSQTYAISKCENYNFVLVSNYSGKNLVENLAMVTLDKIHNDQYSVGVWKVKSKS